MCAVALIMLVFLFHEARALEAGEPGAPRAPSRSTPLAQFLRFPHFITVMMLLLIAQFIDRGLILLIPLQVAHMPDVEAIAATSGVIISVAAIGAAASANFAARLSHAIPSGQVLLVQLALGGFFCAAMALADHWVPLLLLRLAVALCLGGALTIAYSLGGTIVPGETRATAFGWLGMGVQLGTAVSPLLTGALAAASITEAYLVHALLAFSGAAVLVFVARDLLSWHGLNAVTRLARRRSA
jgi:MFS family permease